MPNQEQNKQAAIKLGLIFNGLSRRLKNIATNLDPNNPGYTINRKSTEEYIKKVFNEKISEIKNLQYNSRYAYQFLNASMSLFKELGGDFNYFIASPSSKGEIPHNVLKDILSLEKMFENQKEDSTNFNYQPGFSSNSSTWQRNEAIFQANVLSKIQKLKEKDTKRPKRLERRFSHS